jgi:hypothetical protein
MRLPRLSNRSASHLACVLFGAALATTAWAGFRYRDRVALEGRIEGPWDLQGPFGDPGTRAVVCEFRPDGTFSTWATDASGTARLSHHGRWRVSGRELLLDYTTAPDGLGRPSGQRPERLVVVRADVELVLAGASGYQKRLTRKGG